MTANYHIACLIDLGARTLSSHATGLALCLALDERWSALGAQLHCPRSYFHPVELGDDVKPSKDGMDDIPAY